MALLLVVRVLVYRSCSVIAIDRCFFFKQKTAYEMRISDWSSDVCSSDLHGTGAEGKRFLAAITAGYEVAARIAALLHPRPRWRGFHNTSAIGDRKSVG